MSRIARTFAELKKRREAALIAFITAGDPDLKTTIRIMRALEEGGADCIEVGIPFSDPTADGPTIQRSSERALKKSITLPAIFHLLREFRRGSALPVILFGYYNPVFRYGLEKFARQAAQAGADGVLCVDLPPEESGELKRWTDEVGLDLIFLLSPTSGPDRVGLVSRQGRGFIYYVSVTGVAAALPVGVGFGISTPRQAAWIARFADAAVVGSALVDKIEKTKGNSEKAMQAGAFVAGLKRAMKQAARSSWRTRSKIPVQRSRFKVQG